MPSSGSLISSGKHGQPSNASVRGGVSRPRLQRRTIWSLAASVLLLIFPTVCFDQDARLRDDSALPMASWASNLFATGHSALKTLTSWTALKHLNVKQLIEPRRLRSLWMQGNMQLCVTPRQDPSGSGVDTLVLHWDGCNSVAQMYDVLRRLGLSAHLLVDSDATVYQMADLAKTKAFHAGWVNERSIGIEFNNPIDPTVEGAAFSGRAIVDETLPHHGRRISRLDFTSLQKQRLCELADVLQAHFNIAKILPSSIDAQGLERAPNLMPRDFKGVCGHYHVGTHKIDPGLSFWPMLRKHWRQNDLCEQATRASALCERGTLPSRTKRASSETQKS